MLTTFNDLKKYDKFKLLEIGKKNRFNLYDHVLYQLEQDNAIQEINVEIISELNTKVFKKYNDSKSIRGMPNIVKITNILDNMEGVDLMFVIDYKIKNEHYLIFGAFYNDYRNLFTDLMFRRSYKQAPPDHYKHNVINIKYVNKNYSQGTDIAWNGLMRKPRLGSAASKEAYVTRQIKTLFRTFIDINKDKFSSNFLTGLTSLNADQNLSKFLEVS